MLWCSVDREQDVTQANQCVTMTQQILCFALKSELSKIFCRQQKSHTRTHARTHTLSLSQTHTHTTHTHTLTHTHIYTHIRTHPLTHTHAHTLPLSLSHKHTHTHTHTHTFTHTHRHTHTHSHPPTHTHSSRCGGDCYQDHRNSASFQHASQKCSLVTKVSFAFDTPLLSRAFELITTSKNAMVVMKKNKTNKNTNTLYYNNVTE